MDDVDDQNDTLSSFVKENTQISQRRNIKNKK
jgi:hypothetical protein